MTAHDGRLRIVVLGYVVGFPLGGMTWHSVQYATGLAALGHDVWLIEDSHDYETNYDPVTGAVGTDPTYGVAYAGRVLGRLGLGDRWAYHHAHTGSWRGPAAGEAPEICRTADVVLNVAGIHPLRPWLEEVPLRVFIDADPVFTQIRHLTDPGAKAHAEAHTHFLTFGERIGTPGCTVPDDGLPWRPTRQPVTLDAWQAGPEPDVTTLPFTTVMQWDSYPTATWNGTTYGMKSAAFGDFVDLPGRVDVPLHLAVGRADAATERQLSTLGWELSDPQAATWDPWVYQSFIHGSAAEWSVAKHGYVTSRSGWFSERSTGYLASHRPVVVQDTGFSAVLPCGEGLLAFTDVAEAAACIEDVRARYATHTLAAREIAREHFGADRVLSRLLAEVGAG
ncbi:glycosyltransferase [Nitriliruptor alkaliphilus]|uniref:glycosyltransferase n=1 Tax=Nitriliruptor alkaliphilus TaxID=427918 RepID=UPI0006987524|nr:hypothetical protein [Nitriliruptor alkaliphilus]